MTGSRKANCSAAVSAGPSRVKRTVARTRQTTRATMTTCDAQITRVPKIGTHTVLAATAATSHQPVRRCTLRAGWPGSSW